MRIIVVSVCMFHLSFSNKTVYLAVYVVICNVTYLIFLTGSNESVRKCH